MKKKICHVTSIHPRYDTRIFQKECVSLANMGYEVFLLVNDALASEIRDGVRIVSTGFAPKNRMERFRRLKREMFRPMTDIGAEVYHFHDPDLLPLALKLKRKNRKIRIIFDSHEDVPADILGKTWIPFLLRGIISKGYASYQKIALRKFDHVIGVSPLQVNKLKKINKRSEMITNYPIITGYGEERNFKVTEKENAICFAGGVNEDWCHERILEAIEKMDVKYILCGPADEGYIRRLKGFPAWERTSYLGKIPFEEVRKIHQAAKIGIAVIGYTPNVGGKQGSLGVTKLFEYMAAGLPVVCTDFVLWKEIVDKNKCGICVDPYDVEEVREAIQYLLDHPEERTEMGKNGKRLVEEELNWGTQERVLERIYMSLG